MTTQLRAQLESLRIEKDQRPATAASAAARPRRRSKRWALLAIALLAVVAYLLDLPNAALHRIRSSGWYEKAADRVQAAAASPATVRLITVAPASAETGPAAVLTATGKIVSDHLVSVATKVSGQVVALMFEQGDFVKKGQTLARIEEVNYRARRDEAAANVKKSQANLDYQLVDYARIEALFKTGDAPEIEMARVRKARDEAAAQLTADQAALEWSQKALTDTEVVAPIDGVILTRDVEVGNFVAAEGGRGANANAQFATIADMSKLRVEVDVSEMDVYRIREKMPCRITPDAYKDKVFVGHVMWIDPGANYSKATVQVKVRILDPDPGLLRVEGAAKVVFERPAEAASAITDPQAIWIPLTACRVDARRPDAGEVFVVADGVARRTPVRLGPRDGTRVRVVDGLSSGRQIIADALDSISDGQRVSTAP